VRAHGARTVALGGGVAANSLLRARLAEGCAEDGLRTVLASRAMCTDNAAMIAAAAWHRLARRGGDPLDAPAFPSGRPGDPLGLP
jgi:N6-L-threonylcarbamoyladenine synthase